MSTCLTDSAYTTDVRILPAARSALIEKCLAALLAACLLPAWGCGDIRQTNAADPPRVDPADQLALASAPGTPADDDDDDEPEEGEDAADQPLAKPELGTPEWLIYEITRLRTAPHNVRREPAPGKPGEWIDTRVPEDQVEEVLRQRYAKMIELAMEAIAKTSQDPSREQVFNNAVHYLADTRLQLALAGDAEQAELMTADAAALYRRNPESFAAIESAAKVLQLAQTHAQQRGSKEPQWSIAYARYARLFAEQFPKESTRAALNLLMAARICEEFGEQAEAQHTMTLVAQKFPGTPYAEQVAGPLRRLHLPGQPLTEFAGSTHDGGFLSIEQLRGKPVLIAFWASNSARFRNDLPVIANALQSHGDRVHVVGVNLDRDERSLDQFLEETRLSWRQIFYSDPEKRGAGNLVARHYGVNTVPLYWLVDAQGVVRSVNVDPSELDRLLTETLAR